MNRHTRQDIPPDYHLHTVHCRHATGEIADYIAAAKKNRQLEICFTDHAPNPDGYDSPHRMSLETYPLYKKGIKEFEEINEPVVLFGVEADYYANCDVFLRQWLPRQDFDLVIGSIHYLDDWGFDNPAHMQVWKSVDVTATWKAYFKLVTALADTRQFDIVGHLDLPKKFGHRPPDRDLKEMAQPALDRVAQAHMGIEINASGLRRPVKEIYPSPLLLSLAHDREIPICFGSDAHKPEEVGAGFTAALNLAKEVGYSEYFRIRRRKMTLYPLDQI